ncbi:MAG: helix-turn-helix domain-containing protein [Alicyclobacillus sp.]|nr:helix-turn-helix domain-containing protein [Alicyclobacillus sp.]
MSNIGDKIREVRLQRGMTQVDLAADLVTPSMISQIEAGKAKPSYTLLTSIANRLGVPVEHFLDDLDDQFALVARIRLAEYLLSTGDPQQALDTLAACEPPAEPGRNYQEYQLAKGRALRLLGKYNEAIRCLEGLREQALRNLDKRLEFHVCKESGHIEYAIKNFSGAMHEWKNALHIGESAPSDFMTAQLAGEMVELLLTVRQAYLAKGMQEEANEALQKATAFSIKCNGLQKIAHVFAEEARTALESLDAGRARSALESALLIRQSAKWVQLTMDVALLTDDPHHPTASAWTQAAVAIALHEPTDVLQKELDHAERLMEQGFVDEAGTRLEHCAAWAASFESSMGAEGATHPDFGKTRETLCFVQAKLDYVKERRREAIQALESLRESLTQPRGKLWFRVTTQLLRWYAAAEDRTNVMKLTDELYAELVAARGENDVEEASGSLVQSGILR